MVAIPQQRLTQYAGTLRATSQRLIGEWDLFSVSTALTFLLLLLYSGEGWFLRIPITLFFAAALLHRPLTRNAHFWFLVTVFLAAANYYNWYSIDNHKYLMTYWCLAIYCALLTKDPEKTLATNARLLIGLCFLFSVIWKLAANQYIDGTFFHYTLLTDDRFADVSRFWGGYTTDMSLFNKHILRQITGYNGALQQARLLSSPSLHTVSMVLSWWTLFVETLIAVAFLYPKDKGISKWRDGLLIVFLLTTYVVATVIGFGWLLVIMGLSQVSQRSRYIPLYILAFFMLQLYLVPIGTIFKNMFGVPFPF